MRTFVKHTTIRRIATALLFLSAIPAIALADSFTIHNGLVSSLTDGTFSFNVSGDGFTARGGDTGTLRSAGPFIPGQTFTATTGLFLAGGNYSFNGVSYVPSQSQSQWTLIASTVIPQGFSGTGTLPGTANVTGLVSLENEATPRHTILGSQAATLRFLSSGGASELRQISVSFEPASPINNVPNVTGITSVPTSNGVPTTVPEPGTWLLLASGLGGVAWYRRSYGSRT